jgi:AbrB family looped-hinge helix DNA binding protein
MEVHRARIGENGRLVIPAQLRRELGLKNGDEVILRVEDGDLRVSTVRAAFERVRRLVAKHVPREVDLVEDLIEERKREAALE